MAGLAVLVGLIVPAVSAGADATTPPLGVVPSVTGPITGGSRGYPWFSSLEDLSRERFVEEEYFIAGSAISSVPGATSADYKTRLIVRRPARSSQFNGTVIIEWLNVSGGGDLEFAWPYARDLFIRDGYAYVGVSAQAAGVDVLRAWDDARYGALSHPGDEWSFDIFSQAARAVRTAVPGLTRAGGVREVLGIGTSQSAGRLIAYVNEAQRQAQAVDGFVLQSGDGVISSDVSTPVLKLMSEGDDTLLLRQPDTAHFRLWEEAGSAHVVEEWLDYGLPVLRRDLPTPVQGAEALSGLLSIDLSQCPRVNSYPRHHVMMAAIHHLRRWVRTGNAPPIAERILTVDDMVQVDQYGNTLGGVRLPAVEVPLAVYTPHRGCVPNHGTTTALDEATVRSLYPTQRAYVRSVREAVRAARSEGFILHDEARGVLADAREVDLWDS